MDWLDVYQKIERLKKKLVRYKPSHIKGLRDFVPKNLFFMLLFLSVCVHKIYKQ